MNDKWQQNRDQIIAAYRKHGTIRRAAKAIGISPARVHQVVRDYAPEAMQPHGVTIKARRGVPV